MRTPLAQPPRRVVEIANQYPGLRFGRRSIVAAIRLLDEKFQGTGGPSPKIARRVCPPGELSIVFLDDAALAALHGEFLDDPSTTDVITFEGDPTLASAGEICVSVDTARTYAKKHRRHFSDELSLYVVHGWLHLAGYDDLRPEKKRIMRRAEGRAMDLLRRDSKLPSFSLR